MQTLFNTLLTSLIVVFCFGQAFTQTYQNPFKNRPAVTPTRICNKPDIAIISLRVDKIKPCRTCPEMLRVKGVAQNKGKLKYYPSGRAYLTLTLEDATQPGAFIGLKNERIIGLGVGEYLHFNYSIPVPLPKNFQQPIFHLNFRMLYNPASTPSPYDDDCLGVNNKRTVHAGHLMN